MSRKKAEKNNIRIGIFSDKSAKYNLAILETLLPQKATAWQIAEALQKKINPAENKEVRFYRTQKVYSVIQRKKGRLNDLRDKGYIKEQDGNWKLTKKGLIALNIKKPDLVANEIIANKEKLLTLFKEEVDRMPNDTIKQPLGIQIDLSKLKPLLVKIDPADFLSMLLEEARALLLKGIELDRIEEEEFIDLMKGRKSLQEKVSKTVSEMKNNDSD
jgi:hypothetical protein